MAELYSKLVWYPDGTIAPNIAAQVFLENSNVFATLWADAAETIPLANPLTTDGSGVLTFYAAAGSYWLHMDSESFRVDLPQATGPFLPLSGGTVTGNLGLVTGNVAVDVAQGLSTALSTGVISGGAMSGLGTSVLHFNALTGYIVDYATDPTNPSVKLVQVPAQDVPIVGAAAARVISWWVCDENGVITDQALRPDDTQRRTHLQLGVTSSVPGPGTLFTVQQLPVILSQPAQQFADLLYALGPFSTDGNVMSANGANLMVNKSAGVMFDASFGYATTPNQPHQVPTPAETPALFRYVTRLANSAGPSVNVVDVGNYDVGGVLTPIPGGANTSTIQRVYLFGTQTAGNQIAFQYGQSFYASLSTARANIGSGQFTECPDVKGIGALIGYIVSTKSATNLSDPTQAIFVRAGKFAVP